MFGDYFWLDEVCFDPVSTWLAYRGAYLAHSDPTLQDRRADADRDNVPNILGRKPMANRFASWVAVLFFD